MLDTLENVKDRLGITTDDYDDFLTQQIQLVSDVIEAYCRRIFTSGNYTQSFYRGDYVPSRLMELFHFPVTAVASIVEDGTTLDSSLYRLHQPTGRIILPNQLTAHAFFFAQETVVTYTAGFVTIPSPVLAALDSCVMERYTKKTSGIDLNFGSDVQRVSIPGAISIDFDYSASNKNDDNFGVILGNNSNLLDQYRSERAIIGEGKLIYVASV